MKRPKECIVTIFGASGDLTSKKLLPALFGLSRQDLLCTNFRILGTGRTPYTDDSFRESVRALLIKQNEGIDKAALNKFLASLAYISIDTADPAEYNKLKNRLEELDSIVKSGGNFIYYLATPPKMYEPIVKALGESGLSKNDVNGEKKVIVEKPFGYDYQSAVNLNNTLLKVFKENDVYRIDHYLGKETVQNILVLRFSNGIFEPMWNRNFIDHVEITSAEFIGVESRGGYYEGAGALRDMIQNHMMQLVGFIGMEPPSSFDSNAVRNETFKIFQSLRKITPEDVEKYSVRGQYLASRIRGEDIKSYRSEKNVSPESRTETYAAVKFFIDNWRWGGVPFYVRAGKRMPTTVTEVVIHFKKTPHHLFARFNNEQISNQLIIRIQPDEGILLKFGIKTPGAGYKIQPVNMDFHYSDIAADELPSAYERLLLDCMNSDSTLYTRGDAVEECWKFVDPILDAWKNNPSIKIYGYPSGTWGPPEANLLFENSKSEWRYPCKNLTDDGMYCEL